MPESERRRPVHFLAVLLVLGAAVLMLGELATTTDERVDALPREHAELLRLLELAGGEKYYLILDPAAGQLRLMFSGVELRAFPVRDARLLVPRIGWVTQSLPDDWGLEIWSRGNLDPPRNGHPEIMDIPASGLDPRAMALRLVGLPTMRPPPDRYRIRYAGGLDITIRGSGSREPNRWFVPETLTHLIGDAREAWCLLLAPKGRPVPRLAMLLEAEDAAALYRSLPPETRFIISNTGNMRGLGL